MFAHLNCALSTGVVSGLTTVSSLAFRCLYVHLNYLASVSTGGGLHYLSGRQFVLFVADRAAWQGKKSSRANAAVAAAREANILAREEISSYAFGYQPPRIDNGTGIRGMEYVFAACGSLIRSIVSLLRRHTNQAPVWRCSAPQLHRLIPTFNSVGARQFVVVQCLPDK